MSEQQKDSYINKAAIAVTISLLSWNIYTTQQLTVNLAVLTEKVSQIEKVISN